MITEEDLAGAALASMEPELRFRFIEQIAAKRLINERDHQKNQIYDDFDYMSSVREAAHVFNIEELQHWQMPRRTGGGMHRSASALAEAQRATKVACLFSSLDKKV